MYTLALEKNIAGPISDTPIVYTDPNEGNFGESHTQGLDTVMIPPKFILDFSKGHN